jgi:hypothetical protein
MPDPSVTSGAPPDDRPTLVDGLVDAPAVETTPGPAAPGPDAEHRVRMEERGPFAVAVCRSCGWESYARRSRRLARSEGRDHELLYA